MGVVGWILPCTMVLAVVHVAVEPEQHLEPDS